MNPNASMSDQETMFDALSTQKNITSNYNVSANECASPALRSELMSILQDEHEFQSEMFSEMSSRGRYAVKPADPSCIAQAKQKFSGKQF